MSNAPKEGYEWYVLNVAPGREQTVCEYGDRFNLVTYFPRTKKMIKPPKKRKPIYIETRYAAFPGYVFLLVQDNYRLIFKSEYVLRILGNPEVPSRVSDFDINQIQDIEEAGFISRNRGIVIGNGYPVRILGDITLPVESIGREHFFVSAGPFRIKIPLAYSG